MTRISTPAMRVGGAIAALLLFTTACSSDDDDAAPQTDQPGQTDQPEQSDGSTPSDAGPGSLADIDLTVRSVGSFDVPISYRTHPDGTAFIAEKAGRILDAESGDVALDITDLVTDDGEQGFLGFAFSADGGDVYVSYSDSDGDTMIAEYAFADGTADLDSVRTLLQVTQPFSNHNGGDVHLGPDGMLYIALGDGGSRGDPEGNAQDTSTLLGSILRIDPSAPADGKAYGIPDDNPFADGGGAPEIYLFGVRNPWRIAFDSETDDLWVADVGQNTWEEITVLPAADGAGLGANLGWNALEGTHAFEGSAPDDSTLPVFEYSHDDGGCSITGGFVYRGSAIPDLQGAYLFADLCRSTVRALRAGGGELVEEHTFDVDVGTPISFGVDSDGELLVLSQTGDVYRIEAA
ncbi:PQQ-dependent sugar dehydrogenase [Actinospongicola halichondriae]|uniref:PQQ-dependent sugar dehydrogenase n=1 Tax=Actinospongicola halichondriae TaxID=3236844 RepID=UPI003D42555E